MADPRFFINSGPFSLSKLVEISGAEIQGEGADPAQMISDIAPLDVAGADQVSFLDNLKYLPQFEASKAGACFVKPRFAAKAPKGMTLLVTEEPYTAFAKTAELFYPEPAHMPGISPQASIDESAKIGKDVRIDAGAVISARAEIGDRAHIGPNAHIGEGVIVGDDTRIGACSTISHTIIGSRTIIHRGVHLGTDGFGFAPTATGLMKVPQLGRVIIGNEVEIGSNTCIDRGAGPDTVVMDGAKIDNLVQIGHNCHIGRFAIIVSQVGLAGSTRVEDGAQLGGQVGIAGHVTIGKGAKVAARSAAMRDIPAGAVVGGVPAVPVKEWQRQLMEIAKLGKQRKSGNE